jgi:hypothetical protein
MEQLGAIILTVVQSFGGFKIPAMPTPSADEVTRLVGRWHWVGP